jgi:hypothetical protein
MGTAIFIANSAVDAVAWAPHLPGRRPESPLSPTSRANRAPGHRLHFSDGIRLDIDACGWRSTLRKSISPMVRGKPGTLGRATAA